MTLQAAPDIDFCGDCDIGTVREENQDSIRLPDPRLPLERGLLFGLADGMGGCAHGKLASSLALDVLFEHFYGVASSIPRSLGRGIETANTRVFKTAQALGPARMGTTLTAAGIRGDELCVGHVGDSRAYLVRDGTATCLTNDHTDVGELVRMRVLAPDRVRTHDRRSLLNRAVGLGLFVRPDLRRIRLRDGDRIVLCSDGLWSVVEDEELASMSAGADTAECSTKRLVEAALRRGSDDNISVIVVHVRFAAPGRSKPGSAQKGPFGALRRRFDPSRSSND
ncbi:MAG: PP2C family protein-serine/threonine phosphatase [Rectinemataceae bacterium]